MNINRNQRLLTGSVVGIAILLTTAAAMADGTLTGNCWIEKVKGRSGDYVALYEWNTWLNRDGGGITAPHFRVGLPPQSNQAYYYFTVPGGSYSLFLDQPLFWGRPTVVSGISVPSSGTVNLNVEIPSDYGCAFGGSSGIWGNDPWTSWKPVWYQTFIATGTSITGLNFKLAGRNCQHMQLTIHADTGSNVTTWPQVGISRTRYNVNTLGDMWVRFRSGEIPTTPGNRYALKLTGLNGSPNNEFAVFRRIDGGTGYAYGQAYDNTGAPQNFDLYANVFSDSDGTVIPYCAVQSDGGDLAGWAGVWSQQIRAKGAGLAGAGIYFSGGDTWDIPITFRVRSGAANGPQVGPAKTSRSGYQAASNGMAGASWNPGEVPLTPGTIYYLEVDAGAHGFNPAKFTNGENAYPDGHAFQSFGPQPSVDLHMQVVEYVNVTPPTIQRSPASFTRTIVRRTVPSSDVFTVRNSGGSILNYTISDNVSWLSVDPTEGYSISETDSITINYDTASLPVGSYTGTITINAPDATNSPQTVMVYLTVTPPPFAPCDFDQDQDVDQADFGRFQRCLSGAGASQPDPACSGADLDTDGDVDGGDFILFFGCLSGPGVTADTLCAG